MNEIIEYRTVASHLKKVFQSSSSLLDGLHDEEKGQMGGRGGGKSPAHNRYPCTPNPRNRVQFYKIFKIEIEIEIYDCFQC